MTAREVAKWHGKACVVTLKQRSVLVGRLHFGGTPSLVSLALDGWNVREITNYFYLERPQYAGITIDKIRPMAIKSIKARPNDRRGDRGQYIYCIQNSPKTRVRRGIYTSTERK